MDISCALEQHVIVVAIIIIISSASEVTTIWRYTNVYIIIIIIIELKNFSSRFHILLNYATKFLVKF